MNRRRFLLSTAATLSAVAHAAVSASTNTPSDEPVPADLGRTPYINHGHPRLIELVAPLREAHASQTALAVALHDLVRDAVPFGFAAGFYDQSASDVLAAGRGYCNTKGTLFVALLRAAGIPARQRFVDINAAILWPFVEPGTRFVDHSITEVWLEERWVRTDSYIIDEPLFERAQAQRARSGRPLGFGVHIAGRIDWDGRSDQFSQYVHDTRVNALTQRDFGVFADVGDFYARGAAHNRLNPVLRAAFGVLAWRANRRIEATRTGPLAVG